MILYSMLFLFGSIPFDQYYYWIWHVSVFFDLLINVFREVAFATDLKAQLYDIGSVGLLRRAPEASHTIVKHRKLTTLWKQ